MRRTGAATGVGPSTSERNAGRARARAIPRARAPQTRRQARGKSESQARPLYEKILKLKPDNEIALNNLAFMMAEEGSDLDQALTLAQRAKQKNPNDANIADTLGWIYIKKNLPDSAINVFNELLTKFPTHANLAIFRYHLGMALAQKGDKIGAKKALAEAMKANPSAKDSKDIQALIQKLG